LCSDFIDHGLHSNVAPPRQLARI